MSRIDKSSKNFAFAFLGQIFGLIISFIARIVFIKTLSGEYLGLNGLFTNILSVLSLAELGVGAAITYSLYLPLSKKDTEKTKSIMRLYKRVYVAIGVLLLAIGAILIPFLPYLITNLPDISDINIIYYLFVLNTAISYFFSYKRNIIIADQNRYIVTFYRYLFFFLLNIVQIVFLLFTKNYIGFLMIQIAFTLLENLVISFRANKMYPFLKEKKVSPLDENTKRDIIKNTKAMMMHKVGGVVVTSTDNILLSLLVGLEAVAKYSNYLLVITAINTITNQVYSSVTASIGNLFVETNEKRQYEIFKSLDFLTFWIFLFFSVVLLCLFNDFIRLWVGEEYTFSFEIVIVLVVIFYITGIRKTSIAFREASGLFYKDRWKALAEAAVNLVSSIILGYKLGTIGIFIGTIISSVAVCLWVEPYVLFKYGFKRSMRDYWIKHFRFLIIAITVGLITVLLCSFDSGIPLLNLLIKGCICLLFPNLVIVLLFRKSFEFHYIFDCIIHPFLKKIAGSIKNAKS